MAWERDYEILATLGEGSFGKVYKARHRNSGDVVAVKKIKLGSKSWDDALRSTELQALRTVRHAFVVRLRELLRDQSDGILYYVFEYVDTDLYRLLRNHPNGLEEPRAIELTRQLLVGLSFLHQHNFFHRDVKPENILYDSSTESVRLADFGEARSLRARPPFTDYVGTRWYRAPECLLRDRAYSSPVDIWAAGLIFAELLRGSPVFSGSNSIDQLYKIFQVLGVPGKDWPEYIRLAQAIRFRAPDKGCGLNRALPRASTQIIAVIGEILTMNPRRRPSAKKCLEQQFFASLVQTERERSGSKAMPSSSPEEIPDNDTTSFECLDEPIAVTDKPPPSGKQTPPESPPKVERSAPPIETDDLDLDEELAKILGNSPVEQKESSSGLLRRASDPTPATPAAMVSKEASKDDDLQRSTSLFEIASTHRGVNGVAELPASSVGSTSIGASNDPTSPSSPGAGSVDALLDDLCADFGLEVERPKQSADQGQVIAVASPMQTQENNGLGTRAPEDLSRNSLIESAQHTRPMATTLYDENTEQATWTSDDDDDTGLVAQVAAPKSTSKETATAHSKESRFEADASALKTPYQQTVRDSDATNHHTRLGVDFDNTKENDHHDVTNKQNGIGSVVLGTDLQDDIDMLYKPGQRNHKQWPVSCRNGTRLDLTSADNTPLGANATQAGRQAFAAPLTHVAADANRISVDTASGVTVRQQTTAWSSSDDVPDASKDKDQKNDADFAKNAKLANFGFSPRQGGADWSDTSDGEADEDAQTIMPGIASAPPLLQRSCTEPAKPVGLEWLTCPQMAPSRETIRGLATSMAAGASIDVSKQNDSNEGRDTFDSQADAVKVSDERRRAKPDSITELPGFKEAIGGAWADDRQKGSRKTTPEMSSVAEAPGVKCSSAESTTEAESGTKGAPQANNGFVGDALSHDRHGEKRNAVPLVSANVGPTGDSHGLSREHKEINMDSYMIESRRDTSKLNLSAGTHGFDSHQNLRRRASDIVAGSQRQGVPPQKDRTFAKAFSKDGAKELTETVLESSGSDVKGALSVEGANSPSRQIARSMTSPELVRTVSGPAAPLASQSFGKELEAEPEEPGAADASGNGRKRSTATAPDWSPEECSRLRRLVKRLTRDGVRDKEALWSQVSTELSGRSARECKRHYTVLYKAYKAEGGRSDVAATQDRSSEDTNTVANSLGDSVPAAARLALGTASTDSRSSSVPGRSKKLPR